MCKNIINITCICTPHYLYIIHTVERMHNRLTFFFYIFFFAKWLADIRIVLNIINYYNLVNENFSTAFNPCHRKTMNWKLYITSFSILYLLAEDTLLLFLSTNSENNFDNFFYEYCLQVVHVHSNSIMTMWPEKVILICKQHKFGLNQTLNTKLSMRTWESCWYKTIHKFKHTWYSMNYAHRLRNYDANMLLVKYLFKWFDQ